MEVVGGYCCYCCCRLDVEVEMAALGAWWCCCCRWEVEDHG